MGQATEFLSAFFAGMPERQNILIWTLPTRTSYWGGSPQAASPIAELQAKKAQDVYFGVGTRRHGKHITINERGTDADVAMLYGMWLDIDMKSEAHAKENLPETEEEALSILEAVPMQPTILVHSGHGSQAHWLFDEPMIIGLGLDAAKRLTQRWNYTFKKFAARCGWDIDSVFDLARVMRLPGTMNVKHADHPVPVTMVYCDPDRRYSISELMDSAIAEDALPQQSTQLTTESRLVLNENATYNSDKFEALFTNNQTFADRWMHKKMPGTDSSMSAYDMSIASIAAYAGWSQQEIVDLLISHRRKWKDLDTGNKEQRLTYLSRTAQKVWNDAQNSERRRAAEVDASMVLVVGTDESQDDASNSPDGEDTWAVMRKILRIDITGMSKFTGDEPTYRIHIGADTYDLGSIENITSWSRFQNKIATHTGRAIPAFKGPAWAEIWSRMLMSATVVTIADGGSTTDLYRTRLREWIGVQMLIPTQNIMTMVDCTAVYRLDGQSYFSLDELHKWLKLYHHDPVTRASLAKALRMLKCTPKHISIEADGVKATRNVWVTGRD